MTGVTLRWLSHVLIAGYKTHFFVLSNPQLVKRLLKEILDFLPTLKKLIMSWINFFKKWVNNMFVFYWVSAYNPWGIGGASPGLATGVNDVPLVRNSYSINKCLYDSIKLGSRPNSCECFLFEKTAFFIEL